MRKRIFTLCTIFSLVFVLCSCSPSIPNIKFIPSFSGKEPKTAKELLEMANEKKDKIKSCHADIDMDMNMEILDSGASMEMPVTMKFSLDSGKESAHAICNASTKLFGITNNEKMEIYYDNKDGKSYVKTEKDDQWHTITSQNPMESISDIDKITEDIGENAELTSKEDKYIITLDAKNLKDTDFMHSLGSSTEMLESFKIDSGKVQYEFDKESLYLTKVTMSDFKMSGTASDGDYACTFNYDMTISDFNKVDEEKYAIPDDITKKSSDDDIDIDDFSHITEKTTEETAPSTQTPTARKDTWSSSKDKYGNINGIPLTTGPNEFFRTFEPDGFVFDKSMDGEYMFSVCKNDKYEGLTLYLFQKDTSRSDCTSEEIRKNGFYGYEINAANSHGRPKMYWNGVTWGDSLEKVEKAYGKPDDTYDCDMYTKYTYQLDDNIQMHFSVYKEGQPSTGLQEVILYVFNNN